MKIGVVSDIHGNAAALAKALKAMGPVDALICLGDSISQYRFCNETVGLLRTAASHVIQGNHEQIFFGPAGTPARQKAGNDKALMAWLGRQPAERRLTLGGREILMVHATPWPSGAAYVCPHHRDFERFGETGADIVLYGHTHQPVAQRVGDTLVINPGSAGEARLVGERLEASCAVFDPISDEVRHIPLPE